MAEKPHDADVKFDTYRNLRRHRALILAIARLSCCFTVERLKYCQYDYYQFLVEVSSAIADCQGVTLRSDGQLINLPHTTIIASSEKERQNESCIMR